jgi:predicted DNA-binding protein YlxM (UPF0122 family)
MAKNLEISFLLDFYGEMLTKKQHDFLIYYYDEDLSLPKLRKMRASPVRACAMLLRELKISFLRWSKGSALQSASPI